MDEPEKVTDSVTEAKTEPVMEGTETDVVVKAEAETDVVVSKAEAETEAEGQAPMETETEPTKLEEDGKSPAQLVGDDPDSVEQRAIEDTSEKTKSEETVVELENVEEKTLVETDIKMDGVEHDDNDDGDGHGIDNGEELKDLPKERDVNMQLALTIPELGDKNPNLCFDNSGSDSEEEQTAFVKEVEAFYKEKHLEFKHPKFYKENLNLLKLWRAVIKLGGYEQVTSCKLWRQVGESFNPPKTCTTVSWTFRIFYEKALLEYEKHKIHGGELPHLDAPFIEPNGVETQAGSNQALGSGRAKRDAAARAMKSWHSQCVLDNGEDKPSSPALKSDRQLKNFGLLKRKKPFMLEPGVRVSQLKATRPQHSFGRLDTMVVDIGASADSVKINVQKTVDCYEVYALVPGLLREEVHVQSDPAGRLVISGQPKQLDNPWGVTPFKKVVSLPSRIDPHQTSAVVTLHGQLFVRVPFEVPDV